MFGKEWQKVQAHVSSRTSTQARSHAQKFFGKLNKKNLTLEQFLENLDFKELREKLLAPEKLNSTDYDEDEAFDITLSKSSSKSTMNIAMPKTSSPKACGSKRAKSEEKLPE